MPVLFRLDSSYAAAGSVSRDLTGAFAAAWRRRGERYSVVARDLRANPVPHPAHPELHWADPDLAAPGIRAAAAAQREVLDELLRADAVVIGAPMYNYAMPSTLKAWLDQVHVRGVTSPHEEHAQPLRGRLAVIVSTRGTVHGPGTANEHRDHVVPPLRLILGEEFGMRVEVVAVSRTLSITRSGFERERAGFDAERRQAVERLEGLAMSLDVG